MYSFSQSSSSQSSSQSLNDIPYIDNEIRLAILNNEPIDNILHVIVVVSNPCLYKKRYLLANKFIRKLLDTEPNIILYIVELVYGEQLFQLTQSNNPYHLQLHLPNKDILWHKENMVNMGVKYLLPQDWKAMAWIDADIEFDSPTWVMDTLKVLNGCRDIVQLFSHAVDMNPNEDAMSIFSSFGYQYSKKRAFAKSDVLRLWHSGYAWACTRKTYDKLGGLYDLSILGSGDNNIALSIIQRVELSFNENIHMDYKTSLLNYQKNAINLRLGYIPGIIRHFFHGYKRNRKYMERWQILVKHKYSPINDVYRLQNGLLVSSNTCPTSLLSDILTYFKERNEDE